MSVYPFNLEYTGPIKKSLDSSYKNNVRTYSSENIVSNKVDG